MFRSQHRSAKHIQKTVHLCLNFLSVLSQRMMKASGKLDRQLMRSRSHERFGHLQRSWKRIRSHSTSAQFVTKGCRISVRVNFGEQRDSLFRSIGRCFPENWQIAENGFRLLQRRNIDLVRHKHLKMTH